MESKDIVLFDMDGTLCDHDDQLLKDLERLRSPHEIKMIKLKHPLPDYLMARANLIRQQGSWWENLPKFKLGWDILKEVNKIGFKVMILTQGPKEKPAGWSGKIRWLMKHLPKVDMTMTRDKGLVYGKVLVDDYPQYIERWLRHRPRGLVIMPASDGNKNFRHPQVIRYDGKNLRRVRDALKKVKNRLPNEVLDIN
jgi:5'-nucleotidase